MTGVTHKRIEITSFVIEHEWCVQINVYITDERGDAGDQLPVQRLQLFGSVKNVSRQEIQHLDYRTIFSQGFTPLPMPCSFSRKKGTIHVGIPCSSRPIRSITALVPSSVMSISKGVFELKHRSGEHKKDLAAWTSPSNSSQDACRATINPYSRLFSHIEKNLQS